LEVIPMWFRRVLTWGCPAVLLVLLFWHRATVDAGTDALGHADPEWLALAAAAVASTWIAASCCQLGATTAHLPFSRVFAVQVAGSFLNHVLPAGTGVATLNLRMLRRSGLTRGHAASAVSLNAAAGIIVHVLALAVLFGFDPTIGHLPGAAFLGLIAAALAVAGGCVLAWRLSARFARWTAALRGAFDQTKTVLRRPARAVLLWVGSAAIPALHIVTLIAVLHALALPAPIILIALAYLGASALAALVPTPGGFGSLDVALVAALAGVGVGATPAIAVVISYRLLTVWIPLLPGAATLLLLLRRRVI
jgi:uncharacterized membrane protein YbhN (UPF0104 family)